MRESDRIQDEIRRIIHGEAWHGPALQELLVGLDGTTANMQPPHMTHTIHELVLHVAVWLDVVSRRLDGEAFQPTAAQDWPVAPAGHLAWSDSLRRLDEAEQRLTNKIGSMGDDVLEQQVPGKSYSVYHKLHGVVQHTAYHCGQIALLKRLI